MHPLGYLFLIVGGGVCIAYLRAYFKHERRLGTKPTDHQTIVLDSSSYRRVA